MEEMVLQEKPGFFSKIAGIFSRSELVEEVEEVAETHASTNPLLSARQNYRYTVTVRRQISSFDDAFAAAHGLKRGEQQILNLCATDPATRQKIVDFISGVNFTLEGTWEEIGENIYMVAPANAYVEVAPPTPRMHAVRN